MVQEVEIILPNLFNQIILNVLVFCGVRNMYVGVPIECFRWALVIFRFKIGSLSIIVPIAHKIKYH